MNFIAAIDISTFIWSKEDYNAHKNYYYGLIALMPTIYDQIKAKKIKLLLRDELLEMLMAEFPYTEIREIDYDYETRTLTFLINTNWVSYEDASIAGLSTIPSILKEHFTEDIKKEAYNQIEHLYTFNDDSKHKFIAYHDFYKHDKNLRIACEDDLIDVDTLCYQTEAEIIGFFEKNKIKFEHNPKHKEYITYNNKGEIESPFSCYHKQGQEKAQELLEDAFPFQNAYYHFDVDNEVYVKFVKTNGLIYHGFDLSDEGSNVPDQVKKTFNKNGRRF